MEEVWALLRFHKVALLPVIDQDHKVIGTLRLVDVLKRANLKTYVTFEERLIKFIRRTPKVSTDKPKIAGHIMAAPARTIRDDMHILELVPLLSDRGYHRVPIVDSEDKLVGIVTQSDLIAALYQGLGKESDKTERRSNIAE